jgi:CheY-like chemotaxis protein
VGLAAAVGKRDALYQRTEFCNRTNRQTSIASVPDVDTRDLIAAVLVQHGADVIVAESSIRALREVKRLRPDLIISDIGMSGENGYELISKVRALDPEAGGRIPAIALTACAGIGDRRRALLSGFQMHLPKPVEPDDLLAMVLSLTFKPAARHD